MGTEVFASRYSGIESWEDGEILDSLLEGQLLALAAVKPALPDIATAARAAANRLRGEDGRLIYAGAGTSARLGAQDGTELTPTFNWPRERMAFLVAGGLDALTSAIEGAEDDAAAGAAAFRDASRGSSDVLIAVSASGATPYTIGACQAARAAGALTIGIAQNEGSPLLSVAAHAI